MNLHNLKKILISHKLSRGSLFAPQDEYLPVIKTALSSGETVPLGQGMRINARPKQSAVNKLQVDKVS